MANPVEQPAQGRDSGYFAGDPLNQVSQSNEDGNSQPVDNLSYFRTFGATLASNGIFRRGAGHAAQDGGQTQSSDGGQADSQEQEATASSRPLTEAELAQRMKKDLNTTVVSYTANFEDYKETPLTLQQI